MQRMRCLDTDRRRGEVGLRRLAFSQGECSARSLKFTSSGYEVKVELFLSEKAFGTMKYHY